MFNAIITVDGVARKPKTFDTYSEAMKYVRDTMEKKCNKENFSTVSGAVTKVAGISKEG